MKIKYLVFAVLLAALLIPSAIYAEGGFDEFGYNYEAHLFNGRYCDFDKVPGGDYCDVTLVMKWNDAWLSKDGVRPPTYIGSGAWTTNHMAGTYIGEDGKNHKWTYFVKIVAKPAADYSCAANGGYEEWGQFCVVQSVYNDPYGGATGLELKAINPGLGHN